MEKCIFNPKASKRVPLLYYIQEKLTTPVKKINNNKNIKHISFWLI